MRKLTPTAFAGWILSTLCALTLQSPALADPPVLKQSCTSDDTHMCLNENRFTVEVEWRDFKDNTGTAQVVPFGSDDSGLFWFFNAENWEMLLKVLDGCANNGHFWVFSAATTNVEYTLRVTDTETGAVKSYTNPLGNAADALADTQAFTCSAGSGLGTQTEALGMGKPLVRRSLRVPAKLGSCEASETHLCLNLARFQVEVDWRDFADRTGSARVVPFGSDDSGLLWFFGADNWEMLVKVLNGNRVNGNFWVFSAATTTVEYTLRVTDTVTGEVKEYFNPLGNAAAAITDTEAFVWTNHPPLASDVSVTTQMNEPVEVTIVGTAASDPDGAPEPLEVSSVTQPASGGTASVLPGRQSVSFNPDLGFVTGTEPVTFTYTVFDGEDSAIGNVHVEVTSLPAPTCADLTATPDTIDPGGTSTLSWSQTNGVSAKINGQPVPLDGPFTVSPAMTESYTLEIAGAAGTQPAICGPVTVTVNPFPDPTCSDFMASPQVIQAGASSTLSWTQTDGVSATISGESVPLDGPWTVSPASTHSYMLEIVGQPGTTPATCGPVIVTVETGPADGTYSGRTAQGKSFRITVNGGKIKSFFFAFSCGSLTGEITTTFSSGCTINSNGSFSCGGTPICIPFSVRARISGSFSGHNVSGSASFAADLFGCCQTSTPFSASGPAITIGDAPDSLSFGWDAGIRTFGEVCRDDASLDEPCVEVSLTLPAED